MAIRLETKPSMLRRCRGWDYRQPCIYMITLVLADRRSQALGRLVIPGASAPGTGQTAPGTGQTALGTGEVALGTGEAALGIERAVSSAGQGLTGSLLEAAASSYIALSPAGEAVMREWRDIGAHHPEIKPLFMQVMPDHVHFILQVLRPMEKSLGNAIGGFKAGTSKAAIGGPGLWAEGFQDTILFHEGQLDAMFRYLRDNPRRLAVKRLCPELFKVRRNLKLPLHAQDRPLQAQDRPPKSQATAGSVPGAARSVPGAEAPGCGYFSAIGNHFLLDSPNKLQVQCSRSLFAYRRIPKPGGGVKIARDADGAPLVAYSSPEFEEKRDELLAAAKHGAVLISPCISDGEREIARLAYAAGANIVALRNMGFSPLYKPGGKLFDKAADGKLLMLAPAAWPYQTADKPITRFDACALNRIAQFLAADGAIEINYKGMKPDDIDRLVREAVANRDGSTLP